MTVLVTGGTEYIGSHMVHTLLDRGRKVVVLDYLSTGVRANVAQDASFVLGSVGDTALMKRVLAEHAVETVIHFSGSVIVPESVENPILYYSNNTFASLHLVNAFIHSGVKKFIFSSTAAVYGITERNPVLEKDETNPINPYGRSKLMTEWLLDDAAHAHDFRFVALRYFNVAGADPKGRTGQSTPRATHLIKRACQAALGRVPQLEIFGTDFPTRDGTGIRDYIHVSDLAEVHALALEYLGDGGESQILNCGYGRGFSVREVIDVVSKVSQRPLPTREAPRRAGDPPVIVADCSRVTSEFGWQPRHNHLEEIVSTAYAWERRLNAA